MHYTYSKEFGKHCDNLTGAAVSIIQFFSFDDMPKKDDKIVRRAFLVDI